MKPADLESCLRFWAPILRLADYELRASADPSIPPGEYDLTADHTYKRAVIRVGPGEGEEECLLRALVRVHFAPLGTQDDIEEERAAGALARGLLELRHGGAPPSLLRSRAAPRLRAAFMTIDTKETPPMDQEMLNAVRDALRAGKPNDAAELLKGVAPEEAGRILALAALPFPPGPPGPAAPSARARGRGPVTPRLREVAAKMGVVMPGSSAKRDERGRRRWPVEGPQERARRRLAA